VEDDLVLVLEQGFGILTVQWRHFRILTAKAEFVLYFYLHIIYNYGVLVIWCMGEDFSFTVIVQFKFINLCYTLKWDSILINSKMCEFILFEICEI